jgi:hypothetical protein
VLTVEDLISALTKLPSHLPVAVLFAECDGDKFALPVERVSELLAAQVLEKYGLEVAAGDYDGPVVLVSAIDG